MTTLAHKIRLYPTKAQEIELMKACGVARFTWNWAVAAYAERKKAGAEKVSKNDLKKEFNQLKKEQFPWVYESPKDCNQQPFSNLQKSLKRFYESKKSGKSKVGFPKFHKKGVSKDSFFISNDKASIKEGKLHLPLLSPIKLAEELRFNAAKVMSYTVSRTANYWFVSVSCQLASLNLKYYGLDNLNKIPRVTGKFKPVEIQALAGPCGPTKLGSMKQESRSEHSLRK